MSVQIALLRGVNVGGNNRLPMGDMAALLQAAGCSGVQTYINSGNAVFRSDRVPAVTATEFKAGCKAALGFAPDTLVLSLPDYKAIVAANPFPEATEQGKALHVYFALDAPLSGDIAAMQADCNAVERFVLTPRAFYIFTPEKLTDSALMPRLGKHVRQKMTGRNWNTVGKLLGMARAL